MGTELALEHTCCRLDVKHAVSQGQGEVQEGAPGAGLSWPNVGSQAQQWWTQAEEGGWLALEHLLSAEHACRHSDCQAGCLPVSLPYCPRSLAISGPAPRMTEGQQASPCEGEVVGGYLLRKRGAVVRPAQSSSPATGAQAAHGSSPGSAAGAEALATDSRGSQTAVQLADSWPATAEGQAQTDAWQDPAALEELGALREVCALFSLCAFQLAPARQHGLTMDHCRQRQSGISCRGAQIGSSSRSCATTWSLLICVQKLTCACAWQVHEAAAALIELQEAQEAVRRQHEQVCKRCFIVKPELWR